MSKKIIDYRTPIMAVLQVFMIVGALVLSFAVRFDFAIPSLYQTVFWQLLPAILIIKMAVFWRMRLLRGWWRYVSMSDLISIFKGNILASLGFVLYAVLVLRLENVPRSVLVLDGVFSFLLMGGSRFLTRAFRENYIP